MRYGCLVVAMLAIASTCWAQSIPQLDPNNPLVIGQPPSNPGGYDDNGWPLVYANDAGAEAVTDGSLTLNFTLAPLDNNSNFGTKHMVAVWVTDTNGTFIETIYRATSTTATSRLQYMDKWNTARGGVSGGEERVNGYSGATTTVWDPISLTWDLRDYNGALLADGDYRMHIQFADRHVNGPTTPTGTYFQFTKGPNAAEIDYADSTFTGSTNGANFKDMHISYSPVPEPVTLGVLVVGASTVLLRRRRRA